MTDLVSMNSSASSSSTMSPTAPRTRKPLVAAYAVYVPLSVIVVLLSRHQLNVDGVAYLRIARYYSELNFPLAIVGYWSPLLSWVLIPFQLAGADALLAAKITNALAGALFIWAVHRLICLIDLQGPVAGIIPAGAGLLALRWLPRAITPDMLLATSVTLYLGYNYRMTRSLKMRDSALAGIIAGVAYLAKAYALPFFLLHHSVATFIVARGSAAGALWRDRGRLRCWLVGMVACLAVAGPWIGVLTFKHGHPTFSTAGKYNHRIAGPDGGVGRPRPLLMPIAGRISTRENPDEVPCFYPTWSPFGSLSELAHQLRLFYRNARVMAENLYAADGLGLIYICVLALPLLACAAPGGASTIDPWLWRWSLTAFGTYICGFMFIFAGSPRYYWPLQGLLLVLVGAGTVAMIAGLWPSNGSAVGVRTGALWSRVTAVVILCSCALPLVETARENLARPGLDLRELAEEMRSAGIQDPLASNDAGCGIAIAYHLGVRDVGVPMPGSVDNVLDQLRRVGAKTFLLFGRGHNADEMAKGFLAAGLASPHRLESRGTVVHVYDLASEITAVRKRRNG